MAALALGMFDELARLGLHEGDPRERELLWAASMLHDIGMSIDYDDHHKHSRYLILNGGLPGFTPVEMAIIAQAARYHRKGMPGPGRWRPLFGEGDAERLDRCAVLLRLAEDLERSRDQLVRGTRIALKDDEVELRLIADGEPAVPRWAAGREASCSRAPSTASSRSPPERAPRLGRQRRRPRCLSWRAQRALAPGAVEQHQAAGVRAGAVPLLATGSCLQAAQHGVGRAVAPARRESAAEHDVARVARRRPAARARRRRASGRCRCSRRGCPRSGRAG